VLARLSRAWGNRGALAAEPLGRPAEDFRQVRLVAVQGGRFGPRTLEIEWVREHRGRLVFKFRGVDSITAAEELAGAEVRVPLDERRELAPGEYYQSDLIGFEVMERAAERPLGVVTGWQEYGAAPLLEVDPGGSAEPLLVPFARAICVAVDVAARRIVVELPEGLKELSGG
jgi:16S rRNA processing protein RimM